MQKTVEQIIPLKTPVTGINCKESSFNLEEAIRFAPGNGHLTTPLQITGIKAGKKITKETIVRVSDLNGRGSEEDVLISQLQSHQKIINCLKQLMR